MNKLITESLKRCDVSHVLQFNRNIINDIEKKWIDWIVDYSGKFGSVPSLERFCQEFSSSFITVESADPLGDIAEQEFIQKRNIYVRSELTKKANDLKDGEDPLPFIARLYDEIAGSSSGVIETKSWGKDEYFAKKKIMLTGMGYLDELIGGIASGDLVFISGRPGDGKTTFLLHLVTKWYWEGKRILVVSNEIRWDDMLFKIDGFMAQMQVNEKRLGAISPESEKKIEFLRYIQHQMQGNVIMANGPVIDPNKLLGMIKQYKPDVVAIDGAYLMSSTGKPSTDWKDLAGVSRVLKQIANQENVPVVGVLQKNRRGDAMQDNTIAALAGTDSYGQDADIVFMLDSKAIVDGDKHVGLMTPKNRNGRVGSMTIGIDFNRMRIYQVDE